MTDDLEHKAWEFLSLRDMEHPDDRVYSADEMVDAWMTGFASGAKSATAPRPPSNEQRDAEAAARKVRLQAGLEQARAALAAAQSDGE